MNRQIRRRLLALWGRTTAAGIALALVRTRPVYANVENRPSIQASSPLPIDATSALEFPVDPLLSSAAAWVDQLRSGGTSVLVHPVSRLQRKFGLGYRDACALTEGLVRRGAWTVAYSEEGTRYARIHGSHEDTCHG